MDQFNMFDLIKSNDDVRYCQYYGIPESAKKCMFEFDVNRNHRPQMIQRRRRRSKGGIEQKERPEEQFMSEFYIPTIKRSKKQQQAKSSSSSAPLTMAGASAYQMQSAPSNFVTSRAICDSPLTYHQQSRGVHKPQNMQQNLQAHHHHSEVLHAASSQAEAAVSVSAAPQDADRLLMQILYALAMDIEQRNALQALSSMLPLPPSVSFQDLPEEPQVPEAATPTLDQEDAILISDMMQNSTTATHHYGYISMAECSASLRFSSIPLAELYQEESPLTSEALELLNSIQ